MEEEIEKFNYANDEILKIRTLSYYIFIPTNV